MPVDGVHQQVCIRSAADGVSFLAKTAGAAALQLLSTVGLILGVRVHKLV